jgi:hypothetical protein
MLISTKKKRIVEERIVELSTCFGSMIIELLSNIEFIIKFVLPYSTGKSSSEELQLRGRQGGEGVRRVGPQPLHGDRRGQTLRNRTNGSLDSGQMLKHDLPSTN